MSMSVALFHECAGHDVCRGSALYWSHARPITSVKFAETRPSAATYRAHAFSLHHAEFSAHTHTHTHRGLSLTNWAHYVGPLPSVAGLPPTATNHLPSPLQAPPSVTVSGKLIVKTKDTPRCDREWKEVQFSVVRRNCSLLVAVHPVPGGVQEPVGSPSVGRGLAALGRCGRRRAVDGGRRRSTCGCRVVVDLEWDVARLASAAVRGTRRRDTWRSPRPPLARRPPPNWHSLPHSQRPKSGCNLGATPVRIRWAWWGRGVMCREG